MNFTVIIQARMTSARLPGKVLLPILHRPLLWYLISRLKKYIPLKKILVATSNQKSDDEIMKFCQKNHILFYRGNLNDVLERYYNAAKIYKSDIIVRITSDNPLVYGGMVKEGIEAFLKDNIDYLSTTLERTYPVGLDFEIFTFQALSVANANAKLPYDREHVTPYIYKTHPKDFRIKQYKHRINKSQYRLTIDTKADFDIIKTLITKYSAHEKNVEEIISILDQHPEIFKVVSGLF